MAEQEQINSYCAELHESINQLPKFDDYNTKLPENGLYIHFEVGENVKHRKIEESRIVRVGGHPTPDGFKSRFKRHYTGSKKSSVFLRYVGGALIRRVHPEYPCVKGAHGDGHWEKQKGKYCPMCIPVKREAKDYIKSQTSFTVIKVDNDNLRGKLEKAIAATVSSCSLCSPGEEWLGYYCYNDKVKRSGLWQDKFVLNTDYLFTEASFDKFKCQIEETLKWFATLKEYK